MTHTNPTASITDYTASSGVPHAAPGAAPAEVAAASTGSIPLPPPPASPGSSARLVLGIVGIVLLSIIALFVAVFLIAGLGVNAFALGGVLALVPLAIVFFGIRWIDKWEPEPRAAVVFAFLWGAGLSVLLALIVGAEIDNVINSMGGPGPGYEFFGAAVQAPIVEEVGKGLGVLVIFWAARKHFDGPVDGIVYAAWVAGGFAFTENILYFGSQLIEAGGVDGSVVEIFLVRGIMSPFAHIMFTSFVGIALGLAARRASALGALGYFLIGLIPAILLHAFWNGALFFVSNFYGYYVLVQVPLFVGAVFLVRFLRHQESKLTFDRLTEYSQAGWLHPDEVAVIATAQGRRQAIAWARSRGKGAEMKRYLQGATRLAFARQRIITGRGRSAATVDEARLLPALVDDRRALASA
ncbi:RsiW-degrading membrane proteinase PrsW (M82 family) [Microbacteriaceae bacterium SG_E_30_P1]|uniref:RsiW-degrading membrane proteinase PrsW (M82 family) n=1 Tax=Antiquaquibacter oligotrophicus TaxID=2880260 RepID=A0ABT6KKX5_9MICO|nr:PrsW family intramembrane metalloprotease [Antiquaquibacter oligotrophicus]MDH6180651.1 RsiW-degrading membrane proteinase PrsW (M82 family) [Antiquaquibacter oligotrophicus]UDF13621.1 PrsW family intramembrane metalloprotease [Antiquaquibacter oligotrophicus]